MIEQVGLDDGELVAAQTGDGIRAADAGLQPSADVLEELIPRGVAERVVDVLEVVDVEKVDRHHAIDPPRIVHGLHEAPVEQAAVGQPGERILVREVLERLLGALTILGHAVERGRQLADLVVRDHGDSVLEQPMADGVRAGLELDDRAHDAPRQQDGGADAEQHAEPGHHREIDDGGGRRSAECRDGALAHGRVRGEAVYVVLDAQREQDRDCTRHEEQEQEQSDGQPNSLRNGQSH